MKLLLALVPVFAMACGGGDDSGGGGDVACTYPPGAHGNGTVCVQYHDVSGTQETAVKSACTDDTSAKGSVGTDCATANLLGCCTMSAGGFTTATCQYADSGQTASGAQSGCTAASGTWSTTP